jgi:hypothetical protein
MIDQSALPAISEVLGRLGIPPGRHNRTQCPIHQGTNRSAFKYSDESGTWFCFRCGVGGDVVMLVKTALDVDFRGALRWLGIEPGLPPAPDPEVIQRRQMREGLRRWVRTTGRAMREDFYRREMVITATRKALARAPENTELWDRLAAALHGHARLEHKLDALIGTEADQIELFEFIERTR